MDTATSEILQTLTAFSQGQIGGVGAGSVLLYVLMRVAQGRAGFRIPVLSPWLDRLPPVGKIIVVGLLGAGGGALAASVTGGWAFPALAGGIINGVLSGLGSLGIHNAVNHVEKVITSPPAEQPPAGTTPPSEG